MRESKHDRKWQAIEHELGYDPSEYDEWNTYASDDEFEESLYEEYKV